MEEAFDVLLAHAWEDQRADIGKANLAAMGVAGEHDVDERKAGVEGDLFDVVGLMTHEDHGGVGAGRDGEVEVGDAGCGVVGAAEPEDVAAALDGAVAVDEDGGSVGLEGADDVFGTDVDVVVAEDAEALGSFEGGEYLGGGAGRLPGDREGQWAAADEVSGDEDEVGGESVDLRNHLLEKPGFGVLLEVKVAHLDNAEALEGVGEIADAEGGGGDFELVAGVGPGISGQSEAGSGGYVAEKAATGDLVRLGGAVGGKTTVHTS